MMMTMRHYVRALLCIPFIFLGCVFQQSDSFSPSRLSHRFHRRRHCCGTPLQHWNPLPLPTTTTTTTTTTAQNDRCMKSIYSTTSLSGRVREGEKEEDDDDVTKDYSPSSSVNHNNGIWMPQLRRIMAGIATLGAIETGYLTYNKLFMETSPFCRVDWNCNEVLSGPYSVIPYTGIPIAALGLIAYLSVIATALTPLLSKEREGEQQQQQQDSIMTRTGGQNFSNDDGANRILLTLLTTTMGTFSVFLMVILFVVLQASCPYCVFSAACSIILALSAWIGGCLPTEQESSSQLLPGKRTANAAIPSGITIATLTACLLFASGQVDDFSPSFGSSTIVRTNNNNNKNSPVPTLLATTQSGIATSSVPPSLAKLYSPPTITTDSSERAIRLGKTLNSLDARMYGAYWCSHCYDQKQILGRQVFSQYVEYIECSKDGVNSQTKVCKAKEVPGYPTWEIQGTLYPGQQELDELEDLVKDLTSVGPAGGR